MKVPERRNGCDCLLLLWAAAEGQISKAAESDNEIVAAALIWQAKWISDAIDLLTALQDANAALSGQIAEKARQRKAEKS